MVMGCRGAVAAGAEVRKGTAADAIAAQRILNNLKESQRIPKNRKESLRNPRVSTGVREVRLRIPKNR